jgi:hypothetical protein
MEPRKMGKSKGVTTDGVDHYVLGHHRNMQCYDGYTCSFLAEVIVEEEERVLFFHESFVLSQN